MQTRAKKVGTIDAYASRVPVAIWYVSCLIGKIVANAKQMPISKWYIGIIVANAKLRATYFLFYLIFY